MRRHKTPDEGFQRFEQFLEEWSRRDFMKRTGGAAALAAFMVGAPEFLAACGPGQQAQPGPAGSPVKGGHIVEASTSDPSTFNPIFSQDTTSSRLIGLMFEPLVWFKANGDLAPALAESVPQVASDGLTWTFKLRSDVKWSDGRPLTAEDVAFTYTLLHDPAYEALKSRVRAEYKPYFDSVRAADQFSVVIKTKQVVANLIERFMVRIIPKHVFGSMKPEEINNADFNRAPNVVSGVFKFVKWEKGAQVTLARNENYYRGPSYLDTYVYKIVGDSLAIGNQLKTGEVDVGTIDPSLYDDLATAANVNRVSFTAPTFEYYGYQTDPNNPAKRASGKIFSDRTVRQALYYALDRQRIADRVFFKQAVPADSIMPSVNWSYKSNVKQKYPFDRKKAEELLEAAGWKKGPDGIRVKDGIPMRFELITNVGNKEREETIVVMKEQWRQIGVDVTTKPIQFTEYIKTAQTRDFDTYMGGISAGLDPDDAMFYHSRLIGQSLNRMGYSNPEVDKLIDDALTTADRSKRKEMYGRIQDILSEDVPAPMLVWKKELFGISKRVQNFGVGPHNRHYPRPWMKDVFVTDGK